MSRAEPPAHEEIRRPPELIQAARAELAARLHGRHNALDAAERAAILRDTVRRYGRTTREGSVGPD